MPSMENIILAASLLASAAGALILLSCLANRRAQLVKHFNQLQAAADREYQRQQRDSEARAKEGSAAVGAAVAQ